MMDREDKVRFRRIHKILGQYLFLPECLLFDRLPVNKACNDSHLLVGLMEVLVNGPFLVPVMRQT